VAAAWTVRSHTLKAPRAARRTARGGRIGDLRIQFTRKVCKTAVCIYVFILFGLDTDACPKNIILGIIYKFYQRGRSVQRARGVGQRLLTRPSVLAA
jgi:hypothetical protein